MTDPEDAPSTYARRLSATDTDLRACLHCGAPTDGPEPEICAMCWAEGEDDGVSP